MTRAASRSIGSSSASSRSLGARSPTANTGPASRLASAGRSVGGTAPARSPSAGIGLAERSPRARAADRPATCLDWYDARTFAAWVGGRLPSEAEWEFAATSRGAAHPYPWGEEPVDCAHALINLCEADFPDPVCAREAGHSAVGLCDLAGNVAEWVEDWYHAGYVDAPDDGSVWAEPRGLQPVVRGASFVSGRRLSNTSRSSGDPDFVGDQIGFRVVREEAGCVGTAACEQGELRCVEAQGACGGPVQACGDGELGPGEACDEGDDEPCGACYGCQNQGHLRTSGVPETYVEIVDDPAFLLVDGPFTVELWVRLDNGQQRVDVQRRANRAGWRLGIQAGFIGGGAYSGNAFGVQAEIPEGRWVHVAWSYDGQTSRIFVAGALVDELRPDTWIQAANGPIVLGVLNDGDGQPEEYTAGQADELRISSIARYVAAFEPARRFEPDAHTLGLWHFDRRAGAHAPDATNRGLTALLVGAELRPGSAADGCGGD